MSASSEGSGKILFIRPKNKNLEKQGQPSEKPIFQRRVLKAEDLNNPSKSSSVRINPYISQHLNGPTTSPSAQKQQIEALKSLRDNLRTLNALHARLRFMLKELEEFTKK